MWTCRRSKRMCVLYVCVLYLTHLTESQHLMSPPGNTFVRCHRERSLCSPIALSK